MMKALFTLLIFIAYISHAQQTGPVSQFSMDPFFYNPALAGQHSTLQAVTGYRNQWTGMSGAPKTFFLAAHAAVHESSVTSIFTTKYLKGQVQNQRLFTKRKPRSSYVLKQAVGGTLASDKFGPFTRNNLGLAYALHLPFENCAVSWGTNFGISNLRLDPAKVDLLEDNDYTYESYLSNGASTTFMNINSGLCFYSDYMYAGITSDALMPGKKIFSNNATELTSSSHHYVMAGGIIPVNKEITVKPNILGGIYSGQPVKLQFNTLVNYKGIYEGGLGLRRGDAISILLNYLYKGQYKIGYSYDINISSLNPYNSGSHEIVIAFVGKRKK